MLRNRFLALLAVLSLGLSPHAAAGADVPNVAAAADLQFVLPEIAAAFTRETGREVRITFGSSGNFRRQIDEGAPFELFFSADEAYVRRLAARGQHAHGGARLCHGRIALVAAEGLAVGVDGELEGLAAALAAGAVGRSPSPIPSMHPTAAPRARRCSRRGCGTRWSRRLVLGENVGQAAQFATTARAEGGIIAYSPARLGDMRPRIACVMP